MSTAISVSCDGITMAGTHMYRVSYGNFAIPIESPIPQTDGECIAIADARLALAVPSMPVKVDSEEVLQFRREYLDTTAILCTLAGEPYAGKLTNVDFKRVSLEASGNPLTGVLVGSIVYLRTVLREMDGENWFENITGQ